MIPTDTERKSTAKSLLFICTLSQFRSSCDSYLQSYFKCVYCDKARRVGGRRESVPKDDLHVTGWVRFHHVLST